MIKTSFQRMIIAAMTLTALVACDKQDAPETDDGGSMVITFGMPQWRYENVPMDSMAAKTRGTLTADDKAMTDLWVLDYMDGELQSSLHQSSEDENFAAPSLSMAFGTHIVYFIAARGSGPILSTEDHTILWETPSDTFYKSVSLTVARGTAAAQTVTLDRVATRLRLNVTDQVPATADKLILKPSVWYYGLDYLSGEAVSSSNKDRSVTIPDNYKMSEKRVSMSIFGIAPTESYTTDVQIRCTASDESVLASLSVEDIPIYRNRNTVLSGELFATSATRGFTLSLGEPGWGEDQEVSW